MKTHFDKFLNGLFFIVFIYMIIQKAPVIYQNFSFQGQQIDDLSYQSLSGEIQKLPPNQNKILIFWATWCGPCKVELARINSLVKQTPEFKDKIFAIASYENSQTVTEEVKKADYQMSVGLDHQEQLTRKFKVSGTPTILFITKENKIDWMTTGLSPSLELRIKNFLSN